MTLKEFSNVFGVLAVQLRFSDADEVTIRGYFEALKDIELEFVKWAAERFARSVVNEHGEAWFPKTAEWRAMARKVEADRHEELRARLRKLPAPLCAACDDTGWERTQDDRVVPCDCRQLRRLEVLGRRPSPQLKASNV